MIFKRVAAAALVLLASSAHAEGELSLDAYVAAHPLEAAVAPADSQRQLNEARAALSRNRPPDENCAQTLGANRFAGMYEDLGVALDAAGDYESAIDAYRGALDCTPRAAFLKVPLATDLLYLQRYDEAREYAANIDEASEFYLQMNALTAEIDFAQQRWSEAVVRLQKLAVESPDEDFAAHIQCLLWLAQRAGGTLRPTLALRNGPEGWPSPLLKALRDGAREAQIVEAIAAESDPERRREMLCEALFYLGSRYRAESQPDVAHRYLAAAVALNVRYIIEYHLAVAALDQMGAQ